MDLSSPVNEATLERLRARFGDLLEPWWANLPQTLSDLTDRWALTLGEPVGRGNTSLVIRCHSRNGAAGIIKMVPDVEVVRGEAQALRSWSPSRRVPELWEFDGEQGALLMEAIEDETPIAESRARPSLREVADLIGTLHRTGTAEVRDGVVSLLDRIEFMFGHWRGRFGADPEVAAAVPGQLVDDGYALARSMANEGDHSVLLHGDPHPGNVLDGGIHRGLVAIDPRPCVGEPSFDSVDWVIWPKDDPANWRPRANQLADELGLDADRIWNWCRTFAGMLAASTYAREGRTERFEAFLDLAS